MMLSLTRKRDRDAAYDADISDNDTDAPHNEDYDSLSSDSTLQTTYYPKKNQVSQKVAGAL